MGSFVFYFGFCMFHSYFELYKGLFYYILLHDLHSPCSVVLQVEISFPYGGGLTTLSKGNVPMLLF